MSNKKGNNKRSRQFSYTTPIKYEGQYYPSAEANLMDDNDMVRQGRVFVDGNGQYYTLGPTGEANPVMQSTDLNGVTVTAKYTPKKWFIDYLTMSNDNTQVLNQPNNGYNQHLEERGINGARANAAWEQDHPNLTAWSYVPSALAFATAAAPAAMAAGDALAGTAFGQGITNGLGLMANAASNSTWLPWVDAGVSSAFAAQGLQDVANGNVTPETILDLAPMTQLTKPVYEAGKGAYNIGKNLYDEGTLWDKYTTFQGRFGNYGDNLLTNMYGTYARRFGLPDEARFPADAIRKIRGDVSIDSDGMVNLTGHRNYVGNPHVNTTLDRPVVSHYKGNWDDADTYLFPAKDFINQTKNGALKSIEPSDMFENGVVFKELPNKVTVISGDVNTLNRAREKGMQTLSSPRLRKIYEKGNTTSKDLHLPYATEMQRLQSMRGTPTLADMKLLEEQTGLNAGVAPISEYSNAINSLNSMINPSIQDIMDGIVKPYVYPNGRQVDFTPDKVKKELDLIQRAKYNNVFYDPATWAEFNWKHKIGLE